MTMISDKIEAIKAAVDEQIAKSEALQDVQNIRVKYLGKKGELTSIMKDLKKSFQGRTASGRPACQYGPGHHRRPFESSYGRTQGKIPGNENPVGKDRYYPAGQKTRHGSRTSPSFDAPSYGTVLPEHGLFHRRRSGHRIGLL